MDVITRPTSNSSVEALNFRVVQADLGWLLADGLPGFIREHARSRKQAELFFPHCRGTAGGAESKREAMGANAPGQASVDHTVALGMLSRVQFKAQPFQESGPFQARASRIWTKPGKGSGGGEGKDRSRAVGDGGSGVQPKKCTHPAQGSLMGWVAA